MADERRGRPALERKKKTITTHVTPSQMEWLEQLKEIEGRSFGDILDDLIGRKAMNDRQEG